MSQTPTEDSVAGQFADLLRAKAQRRQELACLPIAEKVRLLLRLQQMVDSICATRGIAPRAWKLDVQTLRPLRLKQTACMRCYTRCATPPYSASFSCNRCAMRPSGSTSSTAPAAIASFGMPKTMQVASSCATL